MLLLGEADSARKLRGRFWDVEHYSRSNPLLSTKAVFTVGTLMIFPLFCIRRV